MTGRMGTRRSYLAGAGTTAFAALAGCSTPKSSQSSTSTPPSTSVTRGGSQTLRVGARNAYVNAVSTSAGDWVKKEFEKRYDGVTLEWVIKNQNVNNFIQRRQKNAPLGADAFVGVTPTDLVRAERVLGDTALFTPISGVDTSHVVNAYWFDEKKRITPTGASYVCIVYDGTKVTAPKTFNDLQASTYMSDLLLANPQTTVTGLDFLLWTVHTRGSNNYLDYWKQLMPNVHILKSWNAEYSAFQNGEAPMVVSYSTDQIYAVNAGKSVKRYQIRFLNDQGYAYIGGVGKFATTSKDRLVRKFVEFLLQPDVQRKTSVLNVGIPATDNASLPEKYQPYAKRPGTTIQYNVKTLKKHAEKWRSSWARQVASR